MRTRSVVPVLVAFSAGLTVTTAVRRFVDRRRALALLTAEPVPSPDASREAARLEAAPDAVVLPFARPAAAAAPAAPVRCGDSGGRTKVGAPCAARATSGGRCHHHRIAA